MFQLRCSVRQCEEALRPEERALSCAAGHHFDRSKYGYWSLLQPQDRRSKHPGDSDESVMARHRWLERGHMAGLIETLQTWLAGDRQGRECSTGQVLDLGCGEGTFGTALFQGQADRFCGIDLSKRAIRLAARRWPEATWVLANADRALPVPSDCVGCVMSLFGRRPIEEIRRVLEPGGLCIVAVPGEDDLIELRQLVQKAGERRNRVEAIEDAFSRGGLRRTAHTTWSHKVKLGHDAVSDALAMTYRAGRHSERARLAAIDTLDVTLSADLLLFQKTGDESIV